MAKSPDAFRTISEVADLLEVPAHVLRFWESRFPQVRPVKRAGGRRYYRPTDVALLGGIRILLHDQGITIRGVQKILREQGVRHVCALADQGLVLDAHQEWVEEEAVGLPVAPPVEDRIIPWPGPRKPAEPEGAEQGQDADPDGAAAPEPAPPQLVSPDLGEPWEFSPPSVAVAEHEASDAPKPLPAPEITGGLVGAPYSQTPLPEPALAIAEGDHALALPTEPEAPLAEDSGAGLAAEPGVTSADAKEPAFAAPESAADGSDHDGGPAAPAPASRPGTGVAHPATEDGLADHLAPIPLVEEAVVPETPTDDAVPPAPAKSEPDQRSVAVDRLKPAANSANPFDGLPLFMQPPVPAPVVPAFLPPEETLHDLPTLAARWHGRSIAADQQPLVRDIVLRLRALRNRIDQGQTGRE